MMGHQKDPISSLFYSCKWDIRNTPSRLSSILAKIVLDLNHLCNLKMKHGFPTGEKGDLYSILCGWNSMVSDDDASGKNGEDDELKSALKKIESLTLALFKSENLSITKSEQFAKDLAAAEAKLSVSEAEKTDLEASLKDRSEELTATREELRCAKENLNTQANHHVIALNAAKDSISSLSDKLSALQPVARFEDRIQALEKGLVEMKTEFKCLGDKVSADSELGKVPSPMAIVGVVLSLLGFYPIVQGLSKPKAASSVTKFLDNGGYFIISVVAILILAFVARHFAIRKIKAGAAALLASPSATQASSDILVNVSPSAASTILSSPSSSTPSPATSGFTSPEQIC